MQLTIDLIEGLYGEVSIDYTYGQAWKRTVRRTRRRRAKWA